MITCLALDNFFIVTSSFVFFLEFFKGIGALCEAQIRLCESEENLKFTNAICVGANFTQIKHP